MARVKTKSSSKSGRYPPAPLRRHEKTYQGLKEKVREIGYICQGSITKRYLCCGKPACACQKDPAKRHGPYYYWTRKVAGKTQSRMLPPTIVGLYRQGIRNHRRLEGILKKMQEVSLQAFEAARIRSKG
jgi:hypothetical protein